MVYRIQYFRHGKFMDTFLGNKSLPDTRAEAIAGLALHKADTAAILDMNDKDRLVATVTR
jgi:hypothetical protein